MIHVENLTRWLSETVGGWRDTAAATVGSWTEWAQNEARAGMDWITNTVPATIDGAIETATAAVSNAGNAIADGAKDMVGNVIGTAWDWAGDLIPDWLLPAAGIGGGGLLALLGFKLARSVAGQRQRRAAEYALFKVPAAIYDKIKAILGSSGITAGDGEVVEGWAIFSVPRYHIGPTRNILNNLGVEWDTVG